MTAGSFAKEAIWQLHADLVAACFEWRFHDSSPSKYFDFLQINNVIVHAIPKELANNNSLVQLHEFDLGTIRFLSVYKEF